MDRALCTELIATLQHALPPLEARRDVDPFANDVFEATSYWQNLAREMLKNNTKVDYPTRATEEQNLLSVFLKRVARIPKTEQEIYTGLLHDAGQLLEQLATVPVCEEGHLGTITAIKKEFSFLETSYNFRVKEVQPTSVTYTSGEVYLHLEYAKQPFLSCVFGSEENQEVSFWIDDLLFLYGDQRYTSMQIENTLQTPEQVQEWFSFIASIWKQWGDEVLSNRAGIFSRLAKAQEERDALLAQIEDE